MSRVDGDLSYIDLEGNYENPVIAGPHPPGPTSNSLELHLPDDSGFLIEYLLTGTIGTARARERAPKALFYCAGLRMDGAVQTLKKAGASINRGSLLLFAAYRGQADLLKVFLKFGANPNKRNRFGSTVLIHAICGQNTDAVQDLLKAGAKIELKDKYGDRALLVANRYANLEIVKLLVGAGADVNAATRSGETYLKRASAIAPAFSRTRSELSRSMVSA